MRQSGEIQSVSAISYRVKKSYEVQIKECLGVETLPTVIMNFDSDGIEEYGSLVAALDRGNVRFRPMKFDLDMQHSESPPTKTSIEEAPKLELKPLPPHLDMYSWKKMTLCHVIIASDLNVHQVESFMKVLKRF